MYKFISAKVQNIFRSVFYVHSQANIMNTQNVSSPEGSVFDWSLVAKDSATLDIGFSNFINDYKLVCDEHLTYDEILDKAKCRWAEMTQEQRMQFFPDAPKQSVSPNLVAGDRLVEGNATETPTISQANIRNTQKSSPESIVFDWSLVGKDSATLDIGFSNFLNDYKLVCDEHLTYDEILEKAKCRWAEMTQEQRMQFFHDDPKQSVSPNLVAGDRLVEANATETPTISDTSTCCCYDTGFANYADLLTMRLTVLLADKWEEMSQSERAAYAGKDNDNGAANDYERGHDPRISQMMIEMFGHECDHKNMKMKSQKANPKCAKPVKKCSQKRSKPKPRCRKPKPKCSRPKPRCAKPKPRCAKPKPRCAKPKPECN